MKKTLLLMILDGFGYSTQREGNAIAQADTPCLDKLFSDCPHTLLGASGMDVGLPEGQMGNSEVGHTNIGAGRVVYQELARITKSIEEGDFYKNPVLLQAMESCKSKGTSLHLMGLCSDGGVHSHIGHLYGLLKMAEQQGISKVYIHCFMDGRDVSPTSGAGYLEQVRQQCQAIGTGKIATVIGRYYAMDRDNRWERVAQAYHALVDGEGDFQPDPVQAVENSYTMGITDEFIRPMICTQDGQIGPEDSVIFFNFRPDRARQLTRCLVDPDFAGFERKGGWFPLYFVCMTRYDAQMPRVQIAFAPQYLKNTFGEVVSAHGMTQLRIAETEKYAHVTFFFNGGTENCYPGEERLLIPSPAVKTYDLQPEMSASEVTDHVVEAVRSGKYDVMILNYANCDMVGHTGIFDAAVKAVEAVDESIGRVAEALRETGGTLLLTADHGNADQMNQQDGSPMTAHTTNPVPFLIMGRACSLRKQGKLADIAPTMLELLGIPKPEEMNGSSLIENFAEDGESRIFRN